MAAPLSLTWAQRSKLSIHQPLVYIGFFGRNAVKLKQTLHNRDTVHAKWSTKHSSLTRSVSLQSPMIPAYPISHYLVNGVTAYEPRFRPSSSSSCRAQSQFHSSQQVPREVNFLQPENPRVWPANVALSLINPSWPGNWKEGLGGGKMGPSG